MADNSFETNQAGLKRAVELLSTHAEGAPALTDQLPLDGIGEPETFEHLAPTVLGQAQRLGSAYAFAHMDPPTPWITWATTMWNASLNGEEWLRHAAANPDMDLEIVWSAKIDALTLSV